MNPTKAGNGSQFYIVQWRKFTDAGLNSFENFFLKRKIPLMSELETVDSIASEFTSRQPPDRPIKDIQIIQAKLIKRKKVQK